MQKSLDIQLLVSEFYRVPMDNLHSKSRCASAVRARHVAMYLVRRHCGLSFPKIGAIFDRDASTVQHAARKVAEDSGSLRDEVAALCAMIQPR